jgi:hypothetical protein
MTTYSKDDRVRPFSNGAEFEMWLARNCRRGQKGCRNYNPAASSSRHGCPMEVALAMAYCLDGLVPVKQLLRCGILAPAESGRLTLADGDCTTWQCPEYRGYDEPDDRPRRSPRPPADQLDIFDPRNEPVRLPQVIA